MSIEFKNANSFRSYPFRQLPAGTTIPPAVDHLSKIIVDAQIDVYCDQVRGDEDVAPLVVIDRVSFTQSASNTYDITLRLAVGFGLRNDTTDLPQYDTPTSRNWFTLTDINLVTDDSDPVDEKYTYLWISESGADFDKQLDSVGTPVFEGTDVYVTGYFAIDPEYLNEAMSFTSQFVEYGSDSDGNPTISLPSHTPILEEGTVVFTGAQLVRKIHIANLEPINSPEVGATSPRKVLVETDTLQGDVKLEEGYNCRLTTNSQTGTVTIIPTLGGGLGEPCVDNDIAAEDGGCSDFLYSVNGITSSSGDIVLHGVAPLQIFPGDPTFTDDTDYTQGTGFPNENFESDFWSHALIFRIGSWGENDSITCVDPTCE